MPTPNLLTPGQVAEVKRLQALQDAALDRGDKDAVMTLVDQMDLILEPMLAAAHAAPLGALEPFDRLLAQLPAGFYRTELRVILIRRRGTLILDPSRTGN